MAKLSNKKLLFLAVALSLLTAILVYYYLKGVTGLPVVSEGSTVIVAKGDIPPKTKITPEMVQEVIVPAVYIQPGAVTTLERVVGIMVREQIVSGEQILERRLVRDSKSVGFTGLIPRDKLAITVAVNEITGVAGFIKAGDYVDIVVTFDAGTVGDHTSQVVMQNLLVLASNHDTQISSGDSTVKDSVKEVNKLGTVTMAVTAHEAAKLTLAEEKGKIHLTLRPYLPLQTMMLTKAVTPKDLVGIHVSPTQKEQALPPTQVTMQPVLGEGRGSLPPQVQPTSSIKVIRGTKIENGL